MAKGPAYRAGVSPGGGTVSRYSLSLNAGGRDVNVM